jgi:hypothetical protein
MTETYAHHEIDLAAPVRAEMFATVWQAHHAHIEGWEGSDDLYADLTSAFRVVCKAYLRDEYLYTPGEDGWGDAPFGPMVWRYVRGKWRLFDGEEASGITLRPIAVMQARITGRLAAATGES